jgi:hypothetical protein
MIIISDVQIFKLQETAQTRPAAFFANGQFRGAAAGKLHFQKRRSIWLFSSVKSVGQPRKAGANRKNVPIALKQGPWQSRGTKNRPAAAPVRQKDKPGTAAPA